MSAGKVSAQSEDHTTWSYPYKDNMEKILRFKNDIGKWDPSSGPLFDLNNYDQVYWIEIVTNLGGKKDDLIKNWYDDYPKGAAATTITKLTFAAIDDLEKLIATKGGAGKLYAPGYKAVDWVKRIETATKEIELWDGQTPFTSEQVNFIKASMDQKEREKVLEDDRIRIGFHYDMVSAAFDKMAKVVEKKGGKSILEGAGAPINSTLMFVLNEIKENIKVVNEFDPKTKRWTADYNWIWRAVSPKDREDWAGPFFSGFADQKNRFYKELDKLADAFSKKVHLLNPTAELFEHHNAMDETLMKKKVPVKTIYKIGIEYPNWEIEKNHLGIPLRRFKRAYIYGDPADDSKYCRLYQVNLIQEYSGGGTYEATYAKYLDSWPRACVGNK
ncbi:MAG: hypothetical protein K0S32_867 [Bacteroidetes bacterium]|jgi:hypothetical protein|nr:hypothetical protein [Bacteroidota bacterium]